MTRKKNDTPKSEPPKAVEYPSVSQLGLPLHFPERLDLRPYTPDLGDTYEHHLSAALVAKFARTGRPLEFVPSPEHLAAVGGHQGINRCGVRELGVRMGETPTEYDLTADSIRLEVTVHSVDSTGEEQIKLACAAFASGHIVRIGDAFLVAYGPDGLVASNGPIENLKDQEVHVWAVTRVS